MREVGQVVAVGERRAQVRMTRSDMCSRCRRCGELLHGDAQALVVECSDPLGTEPGDYVEVEVGTREVLRAAATLYLLPLVLAIGGYLAGSLLVGPRLPEPELAGLAGGVVSLVVAFVLLRYLDRRAQASGRYLPVIVRTVEGE